MLVFFGVRGRLQGADARPAELVDRKRASSQATLSADSTLKTGSETTQRAPLEYRRRKGARRRSGARTLRPAWVFSEGASQIAREIS